MPQTPSRAERSRAAILSAAFELYKEQPYGRLTIEGIAARAGVGKPTIYRRWSSKGAVVLEALMEHVPPTAFPDSGDLVRDLRSWLHGIADLLGDPERGPLFAGLVGAAQHDPELAEAWRERLYRPIRAAGAGRLRAARDEGGLPPVDTDVLLDLLTGPIWFRLLVAGETPTPEYADAVLDAVLRAP
ncbi:TetR/AcrR family transcriptional regulator [Actinomadura opuntiae]|uniref:TetR/AcrR family transcriptional regulator n=1 Tax=Actinomadura sp. OS1-43 TaxID=604315 RepID=UPI00255AA62F|nr:TetR/AcrR family transcriptional regulator [Actinomadura sp. OS1-43]MDL4820483.1 TetR/AcrR family transcriptional regulator [Actinomadura sp. OS1-43]